MTRTLLSDSNVAAWAKHPRDMCSGEVTTTGVGVAVGVGVGVAVGVSEAIAVGTAVDVSVDTEVAVVLRTDAAAESLSLAMPLGSDVVVSPQTTRMVEIAMMETRSGNQPDSAEIDGPYPRIPARHELRS